MRKITMFAISLLFLGSTHAQNGEIQNGGFEDWTNTTIYENPEFWMSTNTNEFSGTPHVTKSADAQSGTYSVRLDNYLRGADTLGAYVYLGSIGAVGPNGGISYTDPFDEINGYYKCDMVGLDSAAVIIVKFDAGVPAIFMHSIGGQQSNWTNFSFPVTGGVADSIFIGFVSTNPFVGDHTHPDSWFMVDNVSLGNTAGGAPSALPNYDFEDWDPFEVEYPDHWYTLNTMLGGMGITPVTKSTDMNNGDYAVQIETVQLPTGDTIPGFMSVGAINFAGQIPFSTIPYFAEPTEISGYYKYTASGGDAGFINIEFYGGGTVIENHIIPLPPAASYTQFTQALNLPLTPDSVRMFAFSGNNTGSVLLLDDLAFTGGNVSVRKMMEKIGFKAYPNPASTDLFIELDNIKGQTTIEIMDASGRNIISDLTHKGNNNSVFRVNVSSLPSGIYFYRIKNDETETTRRFIKQ
jgi:hypothetical protein